jgi:hypothetical protein
LMFDFAATSPTITISANARGQSSIPSLLLTNTGATTVIIINKGQVGISLFAGESAAIQDLSVGYRESQTGDADVELGDGVTCTNFHQTGGVCYLEANLTSLVQDAGELTVSGTATVTASEIGGTVFDDASGTWGTILIRSTGVYDHRQSVTPKTISGAITVNDKGQFHDPYQLTTRTTGILADPAKAVIDIGPSIMTGSAL